MEESVLKTATWKARLVAQFARQYETVLFIDDERNRKAPKGEDDHNHRLSCLTIARSVAQIVAADRWPGVIESDQHGTEDDTKKHVGAKPRQVGPAINKLALVGRAGHFDIETQHMLTPILCVFP